jgi:hypothetical protein
MLLEPMAGPQNQLQIRFSAITELRTCAVFKTTVTVAPIIKNVCLSRCQKVELATSRTCAQTQTSFTHLMAKNLTNHLSTNLSIVCPELKLGFNNP